MENHWIIIGKLDTYQKKFRELFRAKTEYDTESGICTLTIPQAFADDVGQYSCKASNQMGIAESTAQVEAIKRMGNKIKNHGITEKYP